MPHEIMILDCHVLGLNLFNNRFEGASNTMYGTYPYQFHISSDATTLLT